MEGKCLKKGGQGKGRPGKMRKDNEGRKERREREEREISSAWLHAHKILDAPLHE